MGQAEYKTHVSKNFSGNEDHELSLGKVKKLAKNSFDDKKIHKHYWNNTVDLVTYVLIFLEKCMFIFIFCVNK